STSWFGRKAPSATAPSRSSSSIPGSRLSRSLSASCSFLDMPAEAEAHGGQQFVAEGAFDPASIAGEQCGSEDVRRNGFLHRRVDRPLAFATVGDMAGELIEPRVAR